MVRRESTNRAWRETNDDGIVAACVATGEVMPAWGHRSHGLVHTSDAEVLTVAAQDLDKHHARLAAHAAAGLAATSRSDSLAARRHGDYRVNWRPRGSSPLAARRAPASGADCSVQRVAGMAHERLAESYYGDHPHWSRISRLASVARRGARSGAWDRWAGVGRLGRWSQASVDLPAPSPDRSFSRWTMRQIVAWLTPSSADTSCVGRLRYPFGNRATLT